MIFEPDILTCPAFFVMEFYFLNGIRHAKPIPVRPSDAVVLYEVLKVENGIPLFFDDHFMRLSGSFRTASAAVQPEYNTLVKRLASCMRQVSLPQFNIWIEYVITAAGIDEYIYPVEGVYPTPEMYEHGVKLGLLRAERENPNAKVLNVQLKTEALHLMNENGWFEVALLNAQDQITEGHRSNLCFIKGGTVYSAPADMVLEGITLKKVLEVAIENGFVVERKPLNLSEVMDMDEIFITGTSPKIIPVVWFNQKTISEKSLKTRQLMQLFAGFIHSFVQSEIESEKWK